MVKQAELESQDELWNEIGLEIPKYSHRDEVIDRLRKVITIQRK